MVHAFIDGKNDLGDDPVPVSLDQARSTIDKRIRDIVNLNTHIIWKSDRRIGLSIPNGRKHKYEFKWESFFVKKEEIIRKIRPATGLVALDII